MSFFLEYVFFFSIPENKYLLNQNTKIKGKKETLFFIARSFRLKNAEIIEKEA